MKADELRYQELLQQKEEESRQFQEKLNNLYELHKHSLDEL